MDYKKFATACAAAAMCLVLVALAARLWANDRRHSLPALVTLHTDGNGRVFVLLGDTFYVESATGDPLEVIPAARFGDAHIEGDFAVLGDDSMLLPGGDPLPASFSENLQRYERMPDTSTDSSPGTAPLQRCSLRTFKCEKLEGAGDHFHFRQSYRLAVDQQAGRIYVADTARQRVLILDMHGKVLASKTTGLWFPNGIRTRGAGQIEVADTNHHRAVTIALDHDGFGKDISQIILRFGKHEWPFGIVRDTAGTLWSVVAANGMGHGILVRWPPGVMRGQILALPQRAEPAYPESLNDGSVLVPDAVLYRIYHFAADGSALPDFGSADLKLRLHTLAGRYHFFTALFDYGWIIIAVLAIPLLHLTFYFQRQARANSGGDSFSITDAGTDDPSEVRPAMVWRAREYVFRKRVSALGSRSNRYMALAVGLAVIAAVSGLMYFSFKLRQLPRHHDFNNDGFDQTQQWLLGILFVAYAVYAWLSRSYERLYVSHSGIRYQTWLAGPLGFLARFYPSWQLRWEDISDIRLRFRGQGKLAPQWVYQLESGNGRVRSVSALFWHPEGQIDDTGLTLGMVLKRDPQVLRRVILKTTLYRLMDLSVQNGKRKPL
jgi:hypothetical protein